MPSLKFLLILLSVLLCLQDASGSEGSQLEKLVDAYVDTYRRLLNGSTADERLRVLAEDPEKFASLAESMGRVLVNGSLGKLYMLYKDLPKHVDYRTPSAFVHDASCLHNGPCFAKTMDNFDILTEGTKSILKRVAAPFKHLLAYYGSIYVVELVLEEMSDETQAGDYPARWIVDRCGWQFHPSNYTTCYDTVECALRTIDRIMGPTCEETDNATLMEFYNCRETWGRSACEEWKLTSVTSNRCFHNVLMRHSNYSAKVYESFIGSLGTYLLMELDLFSFCRHLAETKAPIANSTERRQQVLEIVQGIAKQLLRGKKALEEDGAGKSKAWTKLARTAIHAGIDVDANGRAFPYPSPDSAVENYQQVGEAIIKSIHANNFNAETYRYEIVVYKSGSDPEEVCLMNSNDDVAQDNHKNVNYVVSRIQARLTSALSSRIEEESATIRALFGESTKKDLCERVRDVEDKLKYKFTGEGGFRTMLVTKCARKFVWYELAWQHFRAVWSTSSSQLFVSTGNYDARCVSIVLIP